MDNLMVGMGYDGNRAAYSNYQENFCERNQYMKMKTF